MSFEMNALCEDDQGQWRESIDKNCAYSNVGVGGPTGCASHPATVGVYSSVPLTNVTISRTVTHGTTSAGALSVVLQEPAPPSGTKVTLASSTAKVLFGQSGKPSVQKLVVIIPPGQSGANYDIDATRARLGTNFTVSASNPGAAQTCDVPSLQCQVRQSVRLDSRISNSAWAT
jgi:hypothetical protein